jgi:hypothetical protein
MGLRNLATCDAIDPVNVDSPIRLQQIIDATQHTCKEANPAQPGVSDGISLCRLVGFRDGMPQLQIGRQEFPVPAFATACTLTFADTGAVVAVVFDRGSIERPIIIGKIIAGHELVGASAEQLAIVADSEISLRCGKASISMKSDGTVAIRGSNVISRASHTNRIRGGNVQIN